MIISDYECPDHGRFEALVERLQSGEPPDYVHCSICHLECPWRISAPAVHTMFVISADRGRNDPKPHPNAMDTRPLAEGRKKEWRLARKKLREERRHRRVKELLK